MKIKIRKRSCSSVIWRAFLFPIVIGLLIGFAAVVVVLRLGQHVVAAQSLPTLAPTSAPVGPTRVVVLLLDGSGKDIVGVWQWWSASAGATGKAACILSPGTRIAPSGRTVGEMMKLAMAAGDDAWVARNTRDFAGDCLLGQTSTTDEVIFVSKPGIVGLVDALGGIQVDKHEMDGVRVWDYLIASAAAPSEAKHRQQAVWAALKTATRRAQRSACDQLADPQNLFRSVPNSENPCRQLETLLAQTPSYIATP
jgi:hypothetical protein